MQLGNLLSFSLPAVLALPMLAVALSAQPSRWTIAQFAMGIATLVACLSWLAVLFSGVVADRKLTHGAADKILDYQEVVHVFVRG
jgi:hypothetical protein